MNSYGRKLLSNEIRGKGGKVGERYIYCRAEGFTVFVFTYQVDSVKHLDFSYRGTAGVRQVTVIIADGKGTQSWMSKREKNKNKNVLEQADIHLNLTISETEIMNQVCSETAMN